MSPAVDRSAERTTRKANDAIVVSCALYILSSSFQAISIFDYLNKALVAILCVLIFAVLAMKRQPKFIYLVLSFAALLHVFAFSMSFPLREGFSSYFTYAFWILFWLYVVLNKEDMYGAVVRQQRSMSNVLILWSLATFVSFFLPSSYETHWGGGTYFISFTNSSFEITPVAMAMLAIDIVLYKLDGNKPKALALSVIPVACAFAGGSRTYLAVILAELVLLLYVVIENRAFFLGVVVVLGFAAISLVSFTAIGDKFQSSIFETDDMEAFLDVFTNGRSVMWKADMEAFQQGDLFDKFFGHGFSFVYDVNYQAVGHRLYAHNDFINILLNFGVCGIVLYVAVFVPVLASTSHSAGLPYALLVFGMWAFNAFFNMAYMYIASVIAISFLYLAADINRASGESPSLVAGLRKVEKDD